MEKTAAAETLRALADGIESGKIKHWRLDISTDPAEYEIAGVVQYEDTGFRSLRMEYTESVKND